MFSMARLMRVAMIPVRSPTRQANVHFEHMYCNTWTLDLLLQSCLNRSFSLILNSKFQTKPSSENWRIQPKPKQKQKGCSVFFFLFITRNPSFQWEKLWLQQWREDWKKAFCFSWEGVGLRDCFLGLCLLLEALLPWRLWELILRQGLNFPPLLNWNGNREMDGFVDWKKAQSFSSVLGFLIHRSYVNNHTFVLSLSLVVIWMNTCSFSFLFSSLLFFFFSCFWFGL